MKCKIAGSSRGKGRTARSPCIFAPGKEGQIDTRLELALAARDHPPMGNIFVSYTKSDRDWAFWLATELTELCHTPHIHEWEIGGGEDIYAWMETRIDAAHHMLCVVSEEYLSRRSRNQTG